MPQLVQRPNETLEQATKSLLRDDVDNFFIRCKCFYAVSATTFPKHKEMKQLYSCISYSGYTSCGLCFPPPVYLLRALFEELDIAGYVKMAKEIANDLQEELQATVHSFPYLTATEKARSLAEIPV